MKVIVRNVNKWGDHKPCDGAVKEKLTRLHYSTCTTLSETEENKDVKEWFWADCMFNQRIEKGGAVCESLQDYWVIEVENPFDLYMNLTGFTFLTIGPSDCKECPVEIRLD